MYVACTDCELLYMANAMLHNAVRCTVSIIVIMYNCTNIHVTITTYFNLLG